LCVDDGRSIGQMPTAMNKAPFVLWLRRLVTTLLLIGRVYGVLDEFTELVRQEVRVQVEPLQLIGDRPLTGQTVCNLSLHRNVCSASPLNAHNTIAWNTRLCFRWNCTQLLGRVIRIESCWAGSRHHPVYLLTSQGCTSESAMITSPIYDQDLSSAYSVGWLSVRLVGARFIRLSCTIRLCHLCDANCSTITPPTNCSDHKSTQSRRHERFWNETNDRCIAESISSSGEAVNSIGRLFLVVLVFALTAALFTSCAAYVDKRYSPVPMAGI